MEKQLHIGVLLDFYKSLLTDNQSECIDLYYNQDLSLYEISELLDISRQGVRDTIKRGEKQLLAYEAALGLAEKYDKLDSLCCAIEKRLQKLENAVLRIEDEKALREIAAYTDRIHKTI